MSGFVSYRNLVPWVIASLLAVAAFALMLDAAIAGDSYQAQRKNMIRLIEADVRATSAYLKRSALDERVLDAMARVPRHEFVPADVVDQAYRNRPLPIGHGQTISQPYIVAIIRIPGGDTGRPRDPRMEHRDHRSARTASPRPAATARL